MKRSIFCLKLKEIFNDTYENALIKKIILILIIILK